MAGWNPWSALDARPDVVLRAARHTRAHSSACATSGATRGRPRPADDHARVRPHPAGEHAAVYAHKLIHLDRGGGIDYIGSAAAMDGSGRTRGRVVDREVARRLVPPNRLHHYTTTTPTAATQSRWPT